MHGLLALVVERHAGDECLEIVEVDRILQSVE
jgi:hypothetical protein